VPKIESAVAAAGPEVTEAAKVAAPLARAASTGSKVAAAAKVFAPVARALAPAARVLGKVAAPISVGLTVAQIATAKTDEEKLDAGISAASTALLFSKNPIAMA